MNAAAQMLTLIDDRWLSAKEAARYLGVQVETLAKWRLRGTGPRYSAAIGRVPRYQLSDLIEFMKNKMAANTREAQTVRRAVVNITAGRYTARRQTGRRS